MDGCNDESKDNFTSSNFAPSGTIISQSFLSDEILNPLQNAKPEVLEYPALFISSMLKDDDDDDEEEDDDDEDEDVDDDDDDDDDDDGNVVNTRSSRFGFGKCGFRSCIFFNNDSAVSFDH